MSGNPADPEGADVRRVSLGRRLRDDFESRRAASHQGLQAYRLQLLRHARGLALPEAVATLPWLLDAPGRCRPPRGGSWQRHGVLRRTPVSAPVGERERRAENTAASQTARKIATSRTNAGPPLRHRSLGACDLAELAGRAGRAEDGHPAWLAREVGTPASLASIWASALVAAQGRLRPLRTFGVRHSDDTTSHSR